MHTIQQLINGGILSVSQYTPLPHQSEKIALFLVAHDYPPASAKWWQHAYKQLGLPYASVMLIGKADALPQIIKAFSETSELIGGGFGAGLKEKAVPFVSAEGIATAMGSVNTFRREHDGAIAAMNSDGLGFRVALEHVLKKQGEVLKNKKILLLGAGGTARAIAYELAAHGVQLAILNRTIEKAYELVKELKNSYPTILAIGDGREKIPEIIISADVVINALDQPGTDFSVYSPLEDFTNTNSKDNVHMSHSLLKSASKNLIVADVLLRTTDTRLIQQAQSLGMPVMRGSDMTRGLVVESFLWAHQQALSVTKKRLQELFDSII